MRNTEIDVDIVIGKASEDCAGFSICKITIHIEFGTSKVAYNSDDESMNITIAEAYLEKEQPDKMKYFKGQDTVTFDEDYTFPKEIQEALKADHPLTIVEGRYPLKQEKGNYIMSDLRIKG